MENFVFVDLFETKGAEYILVISFLAAFVAYWRFLSRPAAARVKFAVATPQPEAAWFQAREGLLYHPGHSWAALDAASGVVRVGLVEFGHKLLGALDRVELPEVGAELTQGARGFGLQVDSRQFGVLSPVTGKVVEVNHELATNPEAAARDPYQQGWLAKIQVSGLKRNLRNLLSGDLARAWLNETEASLRLAMAGELGATLQDGGEPMPGIARQISPEGWDELARRYLLSD